MAEEQKAAEEETQEPQQSLSLNLELPNEPREHTFIATRGIEVRYLCRPLSPLIEIEARADAGITTAESRELFLYIAAKLSRMKEQIEAAEAREKGETGEMPEGYPEKPELEARGSRYMLEVARLVVVQFTAIEAGGQPVTVNGKDGTDPSLREALIEQTKDFASHAYWRASNMKSHIEEVQGNSESAST